MPAKEHLLRRGNVFYFRMRFPRELLRAGASVLVNGKPQRHEVKFSLQTSDYKTACGRVATHTAIWTAELEKKRQDLKLGRGLERANQIIATDGNPEFATGCNNEAGGAAELMSDERIRAIIVRSFIENQRHSAEIIEGTRGESREDRFARLAALQQELTAHQGGSEDVQATDLERSLRHELKAYGLETLPRESESFTALMRGYRAALIEDIRRIMHQLDSGEPAEFDPQFKGYHATSLMPDMGAGATLGELIKDFDKAQRALSSRRFKSRGACPNSIHA